MYRQRCRGEGYSEEKDIAWKGLDGPILNVCANFCALYVMCACCAQEGKLDLASSSCVEHGATAGDGC